MNGRIRKREQDPDIIRRSRLLLYVAFAAFAFLLGRLYWLQVVESERYRNLAENNRLRLRTVRAPRGLILDRMGRAIAETQGSFDLACSPVDVKDLEAEIGLLAEIVEFDVDDSEVLNKIRLAKRSNPYSSITIARDLRFEQVSVIEFNRENLPGFSVLVEAKRSYPYGTTFAHVLGYVGEASPEELEKSEDDTLAMGDMVGKYGLERLMDDDLRGVNGGRKVEVDAAGRDQRLVEEVPSRAGGADGPGGPWKSGGGRDRPRAANGRGPRFLLRPRVRPERVRTRDPQGRLAGAERRPPQADAEQGTAGDIRPGIHHQAVSRDDRPRG
jgi:penicillin-binding protein 2